jgi:hypothetical protein
MTRLLRVLGARLYCSRRPRPIPSFVFHMPARDAHDLGIDCDILDPDRLSIHQPSDEWDWKDYHRRYVELLVEKGLA